MKSLKVISEMTNIGKNALKIYFFSEIINPFSTLIFICHKALGTVISCIWDERRACFRELHTVLLLFINHNANNDGNLR